MAVSAGENDDLKERLINNEKDLDKHKVIKRYIQNFACVTGLTLMVVLFIQFVINGNIYNLKKTRTFAITIEPDFVKFNAYLKAFNKIYEREEYMRRFEIFQESLKMINMYNEVSGAVHGLTKFSDMTPEELFLEMPFTLPNYQLNDKYNCITSKTKRKINRKRSECNVRPKFDWRDIPGVVGPVLEQRLCNACWAFSIVGVMESMAAIRHIETGVRRSIQELIDCSKLTEHCKGGSVFYAVDYMCHSNMTIVTEAEYPLTLLDEGCRPHGPRGLRLKSWERALNVRDECDILETIDKHGPVMAVVNAAPWINYIDGVIQRACGPVADMYHVVQIVGYDLTAEVPHYIIRNSMGADFGIGGYVKLAVGTNVCGIANKLYWLDVYYHD